jgi:segregation and condensation protein B
MDQSQFDHLKGAVEALLFVSEKPVSVDQIKEAVPGTAAADLKEVLSALQKDYEAPDRGMTVVEIANGWQMLSSGNFAGYIREFYKTRHKEKLSRPSLETLAIIAYKQPVSRTDVEMIRGVNSDGTVMHLLNKGLIRITGRKEVPGRPYVYGTTSQFLEYFGLRGLEDLPKLEEFPALMATESAPLPAPNPDTAGGDVPAVTPLEGGAGIKPAEDRARLQEELARARTKLDIEELEQEAVNRPGVEGESSGQSRLMSAPWEAPQGPEMPPPADGEGQG